MSDPGTRAADRGLISLERRLRRVYAEAQKELQSAIAKFNLSFAREDNVMRKKLKSKEITEEEYQQWLRNKVYRGKRYDDLVNHCTEVLETSNRQALNIIRGTQIDVFAENATYQGYELESDLEADYGFRVYSRETVGTLLKDQPELLPRKVINGKKDRAWNKNNIDRIITKNIIQGNGIEKIADSLSKELAIQNDSAATRYARTAMTSAQNAGRMAMLKQAEKEGIKSKKKWLATLDDKTRDAHAGLDGQTAELDKPFHADLGKGKNGDIMFPGDPNADPANVYNCRCTLVYELEGHPLKGQRRAYYYDKNGIRRSELIDGDITYSEWKKMKER